MAYRSVRLTEAEIEMLLHAVNIASEDGSLYFGDEDDQGNIDPAALERSHRISRKLKEALSKP